MDSTDIGNKDDKEIGALLSSVASSITKADKKVYELKEVKYLAPDLASICCHEIQRNRNLFYIRQDCDIAHYDGEAPHIKLDSNLLVIIKNWEKQQAFITPMGLSSNVDETVCQEWSKQLNTLGD